MRIHLVLLLVMCFISGFSQSNWRHEGNTQVATVAIAGDEVWVGTFNGVIVINKETGEEKNLNSINGPLFGSIVNHIEVGPDGSIWLGISDGPLTRYKDGQWSYYFSISGTDITGAEDLVAAEDGTLWFSYNHGYSNRRMVQFDGENIIDITNLFPEIRSVANIEDDKMYLISLDTIYSYENNQLGDQLHIPLEDGESINYSYVTNEKEFLLGVSKYDRILDCFIARILKLDQNNEWEVIKDSIEFGYNFLDSDDNGLWFTLHTEDNRRTYNHYIDGEFITFDSLPELKPTYYGNDYIPHQVDANGTLWLQGYLGPHTPKVFSYKEGEVKEYLSSEGQPATTGFDKISNGCEELYCLGRSYIDKYKDGEWSQVPYDLGTRHYLYTLAVNPATCDVWFALTTNVRDSNLLVRYDGAQFEEMVLDDLFPLSMKFDSNGILYAGIASGGIGIYNGQTWDTIKQPFLDAASSAIRYSQVREIIITDNREIYATTTRSGLMRYNGTDWISYNSANSPVGRSTHIIYEDREGYIWTSNENNLLKFDGEIWESYTVPVLELYGISDIHQTSNGHFWIATGLGLFYWNGYDFTSYTNYNSGLARNYIKDIYEDGAGQLWFTHTYTNSVLNPHRLNFNEGIFGQVYFDANQDQEYNIGQEPRLSYQKIREKEGDQIAISSQNGTYAFYPANGDNYTLYVETDAYQVTTEDTLRGQFERESISGLNFGLWTSETVDTFSLDLTPGFVVCGRETPIWVNFENEGIEQMSGEVTLFFDEDFELENTLPEIIEQGTNYIKWRFTDLRPHESRSYFANLKAPLIEDVFDTIPLPDTLDIDLDFTAQLTTDDLSVETSHSETFLCSYDPNDKSAQPNGESIDSFSLLDQPIDYTIRFQNMGNFKAFDVIVRDTIDNNMDMSSLEILSSSHEMVTNLNENIVTFIFKDINLPPESETEAGSQGYIKYRIAARNGILDYSLIKNTASIYFDFNQPIRTNTTTNILVKTLPTTSIIEKSNVESQFSLYPNPTTGEFTLITSVEAEEINSIKVFNIEGKLVKQYLSPVSNQTLSLNDAGVYLVEIETSAGKSTIRLVVTK